MLRRLRRNITRARNRTTGPPQRRKMQFEALEPRILLSADLGFEALHNGLLQDALLPGPQAEHSSPLVEQQIEAADSPPENGRSVAGLATGNRQLIIVDTSLSDYQSLIGEILAGQDSSVSYDIQQLDSASNGLEQISAILSSRSNLSAVHILSHGSDGSLNFGTGNLSNENLQQNRQTLARWGEALTPEGDLLLYGCNVAAGSSGVDFIRNLADLTGADVAASDDATGHGGDWQLEYQAGAIETPSLAETTRVEEYQFNLGDVVSTDADETLVGTAADDTFIFADNWGSDQLDQTDSGGHDSLDFSNVSDDLVFVIRSNGDISVNNGQYTVEADGSVTLSDGSSTLEAGSVENLIGGTGNNTFVFERGAVLSGTIDGGSGGENRLDYTAYNTAIAVDLSDNSATGTAGISHIQHVTGGSGNDDLTGDAYRNELSGGAGDDTLVGGAGNDQLSGGSGINSIAGGDGDDILVESADADITLTDNTVVIDSVSSDATGFKGAILLGGDGSHTLDASAFSGSVALDGKGGTDQLFGGSGAATYAFAEAWGSDEVTGKGSEDGLDFTRVSDDLTFSFTGLTALSAGDGTNSLDATGIKRVTGGEGVDTLDFSQVSGSLVFVVRADGSISVSDGNYQVEADGSITLSNGSATLEARAVENLLGGSGDNTFVFERGAALSGTIDGGGGNNHLDYSAFNADVVIELNDGSATATSGISHIQTVTGGDGSDTLDCSRVGAALSFTLHADKRISVSGNGLTLQTTAIESLVGGTGDSTFVFEPGAELSGTIDGGGGENTLDYSAFSENIRVDLETGSADKTAGISHVRNVVGGAGNDNLTGDALQNKLTGGAGNDTLSGGAGDDILGGGSGEDNLRGGDGDDQLSGGRGINHLDGGGGNDTLVESADADMTLTDTGVAIGTEVSTATGLEGAILTGGAGANVLDASAFTSGSVVLDGGAGNDTLTGTAGDDRLTGGSGDDHLTGGGGTDLYAFAENWGADTVTGNGNDDTLDFSTIDRSTDLVFSFSGLAALNVSDGINTLAATGVKTVRGGEGSNTLDFTNVNDALVFVVRAAGGISVGHDAYSVEADGSVTLSGTTIEAGAIKHLIGGHGDNAFVFERGAQLSGTIDGGVGGENRLDYSAFSENISVDLEAGTATASAGISHIQHVIGGRGDDHLTGDDQNNELTGGAGNDTLSGGAGNDTLTGEAGNDTLTGGAGEDILIGGDGDDQLSGGSGINNLAGGDGDDVLRARGSDDTISGGEGTDTLDLSAVGDDQVFVLRDGHVSIGAGDYSIDDTDGTVTLNDTTRDADSIEALIAGTGDSTFVFERGATLSGTIDGGSGGENRLDYSAFSTAVTVDLDSGSATATDGITHIQNVTGGRGDDDLTGDSQQNRLSGGAGNDTLTGAAGDDVLSGGRGNDTLRGDAGNDQLSGGSGVNDIAGGAGDDTLVESADADIILTDTGVRIGTEESTIDAVEFAVLTGGDSANNLDASSFSGSVTLAGAGGDDTLTGGAQDDTLSGGDGDDRLTGGAGVDTISGGEGTDTLSESRNADFSLTDQVDTAAADDAVLTIGTEADGYESELLTGVERVVYTAGADDNILAAANFTLGTVTLDGGAGDDSLDFSAAADNLDFTFTSLSALSVQDGSAAAPVTVSDINAIKGGSGSDTLDFSALSADLTFTLKADGSITVSDGTSTLSAEKVNNLIGGSGNDRFVFEQDAVFAGTLDGGAGSNHLDYSACTDLNVYVDLAAGTASSTDGISNIQKVTGSDGDDHLYGDAASPDAIHLIGGRGNDLLYGGGGADILDGGAGDDTLSGGAGADQISGGDGSDILEEELDAASMVLEDNTATTVVTDDALLTADGVEDSLSGVENVLLSGGDSANVIDASGFTLGKVALYGGGGDDTLTGSTGDDYLSGGEGNDTISGGGGTDTLLETRDADFVLTDSQLTIGIEVDDFNGISHAELTGGDSANSIDASAFTLGSVVLNGGSGDDVLKGGSGDDTLTGGEGIDALYGGGGSDTVKEAGDTRFDLTDTSLDMGEGLSEEVTLTLDDTVTAGTFTLGFGGETTAAIAYDADAQTLQQALTQLSNIDSQDVNVVRRRVALETTAALSTLNDGAGVATATGDDLRITLTDGTGVDIDLSAAATLGDVLDTISNANTNLNAELNGADSGYDERTLIVLSDSSGGDGNLSVSALNDSSAAEDLGLLFEGEGGTLEGSVLTNRMGPWVITFVVNQSGKDVTDISVDSSGLADGGIAVDIIQGSVGLNTLDSIEKADLAGGISGNRMDAATFTGSAVLRGGGGNDILSGGAGADELYGDSGNDQLTGGGGDDDIYGGSGIDLLVETRNAVSMVLENTTLSMDGETDSLSGIEVADLTGGAAANSIDASAFTGLDGDTFRTYLNNGAGIETTDVSSVDLTGLEATTPLSVLNPAADGPVGVRTAAGNDLKITLTDATSVAVDLSDAGTIQDVIDLIEAVNSNLTVSLNAAGNGLKIVDSSGGAGNLQVAAGENGSDAAADLGILSIGTGDTLEGTPFVDVAADIRVTLSDGTAVDIDLSLTETVQDILDTIGAAADSLSAELNTQHTAINLTDTAGGAGEITVVSLNGSQAAEKLGLVDTDAGTSGLQGEALVVGHVTLDGAGGDDTLIGTTGDDRLTGGAGADHIAGGAGSDTLVEARDSAVDFTLTDTYLTIGAEGTDTLSGIERATLTGGSAAQTIDAAAFSGDTILSSGGGADILKGGSGDNLYRADLTGLDSSTRVSAESIAGSTNEFVALGLGSTVGQGTFGLFSLSGGGDFQTTFESQKELTLSDDIDVNGADLLFRSENINFDGKNIYTHGGKLTIEGEHITIDGGSTLDTDNGDIKIIASDLFKDLTWQGYKNVDYNKADIVIGDATITGGDIIIRAIRSTMLISAIVLSVVFWPRPPEWY